MNVRVRDAVLALFLTAAPMGALEAQSIAYIDSQAILAEAPGAREAEEEFNNLVAGFTAELDQMRSSLDSMFTAYQQQQAMLQPGPRAAREDAIRAAEARYNSRVEEVDSQIVTTRTRLIQPIINQMTAALDAIRTEGGYAVIFDASSQAIVSADPALDLTDRVLARLREGTPASQGAAPAAGSTP